MSDKSTTTPEKPDLTKQPEPGAVAAALGSGSDGADEAQPGDHLPGGAPDGLKKVAGGPLPEADSDTVQAEENAKDEVGALDFMLSDPTAFPFSVEAMVDTPEGPKKLTFHMRQLDGERIEALEAEHSEGVGPFAKVDRQKLNAAKIAEATVKMVDANGKETLPTDESFVGAKVAPQYAFEAMFKYQPGVAEALSAEIDRMAGMTPGRVGIAEREMTTAVGNS